MDIVALRSVFAGDGLAAVEEFYGLNRIEACTKYKVGGRFPPGRCPKVFPPHAEIVDGGPDKPVAKKTVKKSTALDQKIVKTKAVPTPPGGTRRPTGAPAPSAAPERPQPATGKKLTRKAATDMQAAMTRDQPWTDQQKTSINEYTANEYLYVNGKMRGVPPRAFGQNLTDPDPAATDRRIQDVNTSLRPIPEPVRLFRNAYSAEGLGLTKTYTRDDLLSQLRTLIGKQRQDKGFSSASIKPLTRKQSGGVYGDVRLELDVPAGTRGAFVRELSGTKNEDEWILEPGLTFDFYDLDETTDLPTLRARVIPA